MKKILILTLLSLIFITGCSTNFTISQEDICQNQEESRLGQQVFAIISQLEGQQIPEAISPILGDQNINFYVQATVDETCQDKYVAMNLLFRDGLVTQVNYDALENPTINFLTSEDSYRNVLESENPNEAFITTLNNGEVSVNVLGFLNKARFNLAMVALRTVYGST